MAAVAASKPLLPAFQTGAVECLLQRFAGEDAEGVGDAGLLLGLADAAGDFVIDGLVVGGFAAEEAAEGDDGVEFFGFGEGAGGGGNLPGAGDADDFDVCLRCAAAMEGVEGACRRRSVMTVFQRVVTMAKRMFGGAEIAFDGGRLIVQRGSRTARSLVSILGVS